MGRELGAQSDKENKSTISNLNPTNILSAYHVFIFLVPFYIILNMSYYKRLTCVHYDWDYKDVLAHKMNARMKIAFSGLATWLVWLLVIQVYGVVYKLPRKFLVEKPGFLSFPCFIMKKKKTLLCTMTITLSCDDSRSVFYQNLNEMKITDIVHTNSLTRRIDNMIEYIFIQVGFVFYAMKLNTRFI